MKAIQATALACVALLLSSCASGPYYGNQQGYPNRGGIDYRSTAAVAAVGVAGLALYHYGQEKDKRRDAERALNQRRNNRANQNFGYGRQGQDRFRR